MSSFREDRFTVSGDEAEEFARQLKEQRALRSAAEKMGYTPEQTTLALSTVYLGNKASEAAKVLRAQLDGAKGK